MKISGTLFKYHKLVKYSTSLRTEKIEVCHCWILIRSLNLPSKIWNFKYFHALGIIRIHYYVINSENIYQQSNANMMIAYYILFCFVLKLLLLFKQLFRQNWIQFWNVVSKCHAIPQFSSSIFPWSRNFEFNVKEKISVFCTEERNRRRERRMRDCVRSLCVCLCLMMIKAFKYKWVWVNKRDVKVREKRCLWCGREREGGF